MEETLLKLNKKKKRKSHKKLIIASMCLIVLFSLAVFSILLYPSEFMEKGRYLFSNPLTERILAQEINTSSNLIQISEPKWQITKATGNEANFELWTLNEKDKKTKIGFVLRDGIDPSSVDLTSTKLYNETGVILDNKNKEIE
jgi:hypothetical protein